jgi:hypothetical protein
MGVPMKYFCRLTTLWVAAFLIRAFGQSAQLAPIDDSSALSFARTASIRALTFRRGDHDGFVGSRAAFTDAGWTQFVNDMQSFLDPDGAPTFTPAFVPSGVGRVVDEHDAIAHVRIPGTLTQMQNQSRTTYRRFAVDVWAAGRPLSIQRLTQTTCVGVSKACN